MKARMVCVPPEMPPSGMVTTSMKLCAMVAPGYEPVAELRPAVALQHGVHGDYHDAVHKDDEEGRDAGDEYAPHEPEAVTSEAYAHRHSPTE